MIIKIDKNIKDLNFGILGFRGVILENILKELGYSYTYLSHYSEITEDFDLVIETGVYDIIPKQYLNKPKYGVFGFHETNIPDGKGHAPLQWTVLNKLNNLTVTLYKLNEKFDSGEIVNQFKVEILKTDTYVDLELKRAYGIAESFKVFLEELSEGVIVCRKLCGFESYYRRRTPEDSELNVNKTLLELWDQIRVCSNDKFPAYFMIDNQKIILNYFKDDNK